MIFDRGYDDNKLIEYIDQSVNYFVIRMNDKMNFLFKGKKKNAYQEAVKRKGKVRMNLWFENSNVTFSLKIQKKETDNLINFPM